MMLNKETKAYKNKLEYTDKYNREKTKSFAIRFSREYDSDLLKRLEKEENKSGLIKKLLREYYNISELHTK